MITKTVAVQGMSNDQDREKVNSALHSVWGVRHVDVSIIKGEVIISYDEKAASLEDFAQAIIESGFQVQQ